MIDMLKRSKEDRMMCSKLEVFMPDEFAARGCSYHIQQAVEKQLKAFILAYGYDYQRTHNIQVLLNQIKEYDLPLDGNLCNDIEDISDTLTAWEATSRYDADSTFTGRKYNRAKNIYDRMETVLNQIVEQYEVQSSELDTACDKNEDDDLLPSPDDYNKKKP